MMATAFSRSSTHYDSGGLFLRILPHLRKRVAEVEGDVQRAVLVYCDPVDQLGQDGAGQALDIAVLLKVLDKVVGRDMIIIRLTEGRFELFYALGQVPLRLLILLLHDPILIDVDDAVLEIGIEIRHPLDDLLQFLLLLLELLVQSVIQGTRLILFHPTEHLVGIHRGVHHLPDAVQHAVVQPLVSDSVRGTSGLALAV